MANRLLGEVGVARLAQCIKKAGIEEADNLDVVVHKIYAVAVRNTVAPTKLGMCIDEMVAVSKAQDTLKVASKILTRIEEVAQKAHPDNIVAQAQFATEMVLKKMGEISGKIGLDLSGMELTHIPDFLQHFTPMVQLDISNNNITHLPLWLHSEGSNVMVINMANNPLNPKSIFEFTTVLAQLMERDREDGIAHIRLSGVHFDQVSKFFLGLSGSQPWRFCFMWDKPGLTSILNDMDGKATNHIMNSLPKVARAKFVKNLYAYLKDAKPLDSLLLKVSKEHLNDVFSQDSDHTLKTLFPKAYRKWEEGQTSTTKYGTF